MRGPRPVAWAALPGVLVAFALLSGCAALLPQPPAEIHREVLDKLPSGVPQRNSRAAALLVLSPQSRPVYDTPQMAYMVRPHEIAFFAQHEWAETPAQMLQPLLVKTLQDTRFFSAVLSPPYAGRYGYALRTEIRELVADFTSEPAAVQLSLRVELTDRTAAPVAVQEIAVREPMQARTPYAGVVAANEAAAKALLEIARFVLDKAR